MVDQIEGNEVQIEGNEVLLANVSAETEAEDETTATASATGTNLLTNGSFENPVLPEEGFGGFETVEGWNAITDGQIEVWRNRLGIEATDGVNFLELDYVDGQDGFSQSVETVAGQDYTLTFDTRLSEAQDIASQGVEVMWNGEVIATVYPGSTEWEEMSFTVTGTGGSDTLTIREPGDGTQNDGLGALLDNFALVADGGPVFNEIVGTDERDTLFGTSQDDRIQGLDGNDSLYGLDGNDVLEGGDGTDNLFGGIGDDILDGGNGWDAVNYTNFRASDYTFSVNLTTGLATGTNGAGNTFTDRLLNIEVVITSDKDDVIVGNENDDSFFSYAGNDIINGAGGNDRFTGGTGADRITGGDGADTILYFRPDEIFGDVITDFSADDVLEIRFSSQTDGAVASYIGTASFRGVAGEMRSEQVGADTIIEVDADGDGASDGAMTLLNFNGGLEAGISASGGITLNAAPDEPVFNEIVGTGERDNLFGTAGNDQILAQGGADLVYGSLGDDIIDGGEGLDRVSYTFLDDYAFDIDLSIGRASADDGNGASFVDQLQNVENVFAADQDDTISGNEDANMLYGQGGDDVIFGRGGSDQLIGGDGSDHLIGGDGFDLLVGGLGNNILDGGNDIDSADYRQSSLSDYSFNIDLSVGSSLATDSAGNTFSDALIDVENVYTNDSNDTINGDAGRNVIGTDSGDDVIDGGDGDDVLIPGLGRDLISGGEGKDTFWFQFYEELFGDQITDFSNQEIIDVFYDSSIAASEWNLIGSEAFTGVAGEIRFEQAGENTVIEFDGDGDGAADGALTLLNYSESLELSNFTGRFQLVAVLGEEEPNEVIGTEERDTLFGTDGNDLILGLGGDDTLRGREGNDHLIGGDGNDELLGGLGTNILDGGDGFDTASYNETNLYDYDFYIDLTAGTAIGSEINGNTVSDTLISIERVVTLRGDDTVIGDDADNTIISIGGDDTLIGGAGNDTLLGGSGNNQLYGGTGDDRLYADDGNSILDGGDGIDWIQYGGSYVPGSEPYVLELNLELGYAVGSYPSGITFTQELRNIENIVTGRSDDTIVGDANDNIIFSNDGDDIISGGAGDDRLEGRQGDDEIYGDAGADDLRGGAGEDIIFGGEGNDILSGSEGADRLTGGEDTDTFFYSDRLTEMFGDEILDFTSGEAIEFRYGIEEVQPTFIGSDAFGGNAGEIRNETVGTDTIFQIDLDGDGLSDGSMIVRNYSEDFVLQSVSGGFQLVGRSTINEIIGTNEGETLTGTDGDDRILGLAGSDRIIGSLGNDEIEGGADFDRLDYSSLSEFSLDIDLSAGRVTGEDVDGNSFTDQLEGIEWISGSDLNDTIRGDEGNNHLNGNGGDDVIFGGAGFDTLSGGAGSDMLIGGEGSDTLRSGQGNDFLDGGEGMDVAAYEQTIGFAYDVNLLTGVVTGNDGNGNTFTDQLVNIEYVVTSTGNDVVVGDDGSNFLITNAGDDVIDGRGGDDTISGGAGSDRMTGGEGSDQFTILNPEYAFGDVITDFSRGDGLQIFNRFDDEDAVASYIGSDAFSGVVGQIRSERVGIDTVLEMDIDGDGVSDGSMTLENFSGTLDAALIGDRIFISVGSEPPTPGTNLLTNGSFENPALPEEGFAGFEAVEGWTAIEDGQIEIWSNRLGIEATDGVNFLELDYVDGLDGFSQAVETVAGQSYTLTFDTRLSETYDVDSQGIEVVWNGEVIATVYPGSTEWEEMSFTVTGTGGSDTLTIREPGDGTQNDGLGALLDNFALVADGAEAEMAGTVKLDLDLAESSDIIDGGDTSSDFVSTVFEASANQAIGQGSGSNPLEAAYLAHHVQSVADALLDNAPVMLGVQDYDADMGLFSVEDSLIDASWDIA